MEEILEKHIPKYFDTSNTADNIGESILSPNAFMTLIDAFRNPRTSEAVETERTTTKMEKQRKLQTVDADVEGVTQKSASPPNHTD